MNKILSKDNATSISAKKMTNYLLNLEVSRPDFNRSRVYINFNLLFLVALLRIINETNISFNMGIVISDYDSGNRISSSRF